MAGNQNRFRGSLCTVVHRVRDSPAFLADARANRLKIDGIRALGATVRLEGDDISQGGFSTKVHLRAEGAGKPLTLVLTPGQAHEAPVVSGEAATHALELAFEITSQIQRGR